MALSKETIAALAALVGKTAEEMTTAITQEEEVVIEVPKLHSQDDLNTYGTNRFNEGKKAAGEIMVKDLRAAHPDIDYSGKKIDGFLDKFKEHVLVDADKNPDQKVTELQESLNTLQSKYNTDIAAKDGEILNLNKNTFKMKKNQEMLSYIPDGTVIPKDDLVTLINSKYEVREEDGKEVVLKNGEVIKDELQNAVPLKTVVETFVDEGKYVKKPGMGGDDEEELPADGKYKSMSQYMKDAESKGIDPNSEAGHKLLSENKAEGFDYNA